MHIYESFPFILGLGEAIKAKVSHRVMVNVGPILKMALCSAGRATLVLSLGILE